MTEQVDVMTRIRELVHSQPVMLFMKGTPQFPMCGFSARTVQALNSTGVPFGYVNVLEDSEVRANLHRFADWPTFPQVYVCGELIGGCDIVAELHQNGELKQALSSSQTA